MKTPKTLKLRTPIPKGYKWLGTAKIGSKLEHEFLNLKDEKK